MMEDPSADYHLYWEQPPSRMFVVKKIGDPQVTKKFVEVALWLIEVSLVSGMGGGTVMVAGRQ